MLRAFVTFSLLALMLGCASYPEADTARAAFSEKSGPLTAPQLVPMEGLSAQAVPGRATAEARDALAARAAGLRVRAAAMLGPVQSPETRARLAAALAAYPTKFANKN